MILEDRPATDHIALVPLMKAASKCPALDATMAMRRSITLKMAAVMELTQQVPSTVAATMAPMWCPPFMDMKITQGLMNPSAITDEYAISHKQG